MMERSEPPTEVVNVFFRTTSVTPSRPDIAKKDKAATVRARACVVGDRSCNYLHATTMTATATAAATFFQPACMSNHRMQVRHLLCECGGTARARAGYF